ncbi:MAG TPA: hypothetical protein VF278_04925, partial [Pirellulales bacterium]
VRCLWQRTPREKEEGRRRLPPFLAVNHCSTGASPAVTVRNKYDMESQRLSENSPWGGPPARLEAKDGSASRPTIPCHGEIRVFG